MAIMAIGGIDSIKKNPNLNFTGRNLEEGHEFKENYNSGSLKKVPVVALMVMTPSLLSAAVDQGAIPLKVSNDMEVYYEPEQNTGETAVLTTAFPETEEVEQYGQRLPDNINSKTIQYKKSFNYQGKRYTMYYHDGLKPVRSDKNTVSAIYFIPSDYNYIEKYGNAKNYPPSMKQLVYHDLGDLNKDYVSIITTEEVCDRNGENSHFVKREIRLPDDIANDLIDLYNGKTSLNVTQTLRNMVIETKSPNLLGSY